MENQLFQTQSQETFNSKSDKEIDHFKLSNTQSQFLNSQGQNNSFIINLKQKNVEGLSNQRNNTKKKAKRLKKTAYVNFQNIQHMKLLQNSNQQLSKESNRKSNKSIDNSSQTFNKILYTSNLMSKRLNNKEQFTNSQVIYENDKKQTSSPKTSLNNFKIIKKNQEYAQLQINQIQLSNLFNQQKKKHSQITQYFRNKVIVLQQKIGILNKKIDRQTYKNNQFKICLKKFQQTRVDEKIIGQFRNLIQQNKVQYQRMINKKVQTSLYIRDIKRLQQKIGLSQKQLNKKAQKQQVKKAIKFLEQKIRQIILVLVQNGEDQKNSAIIKTPLKCLTCDKQIMKNSLENKFKTQRIKINLPKRCQSGHIRMKMKCDTFNNTNKSLDPYAQ